jgi:hypothetical protein
VSRVRFFSANLEVRNKILIAGQAESVAPSRPFL